MAGWFSALKPDKRFGDLIRRHQIQETNRKSRMSAPTALSATGDLGLPGGSPKCLRGCLAPLGAAEGKRRGGDEDVAGPGPGPPLPRREYALYPTPSMRANSAKHIALIDPSSWVAAHTNRGAINMYS
jgi:hypothetical protein